MNYSLSYEDAKALLIVFYNSPYQVSAPFVEILHKMKAEDGSIFGDAIAAEKAATQAAANAAPSEEVKEVA